MQIGEMESAVISFQKQLKNINHQLNTGETKKAFARRQQEGWFEKYAPEDKSGIDIGCQYDPLNNTFRRYDIIFGDEDAQYMVDIPDESFYTVYASHVLEHMRNPFLALQNWWRILKPNGHLIFMIPHRDLYEMKTELPSNWNIDHKWFFLPENSEEPCTIGVAGLISKVIPNGNLISLKVLDEGYKNTGLHPEGEFSIEAIIRK